LNELNDDDDDDDGDDENHSKPPHTRVVDYTPDGNRDVR